LLEGELADEPGRHRERGRPVHRPPGSGDGVHDRASRDHADPPGGRGGAGRPLRHQGVPRHRPWFGARAAGDARPDDQGLGGVGPGGVNLRPSGPRPLPGSAGTPPLRYRSTGKKSWACARTGWLRYKRGEPAALRAAPPPRLRWYSPAPLPLHGGEILDMCKDRVASVQAGTPPLRYRSTGEKSGASSALVEPAGDLEERLDEVLAMPGRDDMGHLVG